MRPNVKQLQFRNRHEGISTLPLSHLSMKCFPVLGVWYTRSKVSVAKQKKTKTKKIKISQTPSWQFHSTHSIQLHSRSKSTWTIQKKGFVTSAGISHDLLHTQTWPWCLCMSLWLCCCWWRQCTYGQSGRADKAQSRLFPFGLCEGGGRNPLDKPQLG